eukprot:7309069-Alexandrium_andersonii.AAC.1
MPLNALICPGRGPRGVGHGPWAAGREPRSRAKHCDSCTATPFFVPEALKSVGAFGNLRNHPKTFETIRNHPKTHSC